MKSRFALLLCLLLWAVPAVAAPIGNPITWQGTSAAAGSLIPTAPNLALYSLDVTSGASAGYVLVFDATSVPADGTVTPALCYKIAATSTIEQTWGNLPLAFQNGIVVVFSTTGCFSKTISSTAFISVQAQ